MSAAAAAQPRVPDHRSAGKRAYHWALGVILGVAGMTGAALWAGNEYPSLATFPRTVVASLIFWPIFAAAMWWALGKIPFFARLPRGVKWTAFVWGFFIATGMVGMVEATIGNALDMVGPTVGNWVPAVVAPFFEETAKALGVVVVFLYLRRPVTLVDGFAAGAMVGLGFQVNEDLGYGPTDAWSAGSDGWGTIWETLLGRAVTGVVSSHWVLTGVFGVGIAYLFTRTSAGWGRRVGVLVGLAAIAMGCHFLWNSPGPDGFFGTWVLTAAKMAVIAAIGFLIMRWSRDDEGSFYTRYLGGVDRQVVSDTERVTLERGRTRFSARRAASKTCGWSAWRWLARLQRTQAELAVARATGSSQAVGLTSRIKELKDAEKNGPRKASEA